MAIWLLTAALALPLAEIVVFVLVALWIGFAWTALAVLATSLAGAMMLRHAGGAHIARIRVVLGPQRVTALEADSAGTMYLLAAILLLIPGFISDAIGVALLVPPLRRAIGMLLRRGAGAGQSEPGIVDLDRDEWRREADPRLRDQRPPDRR